MKVYIMVYYISTGTQKAWLIIKAIFGIIFKKLKGDFKV